MFSGRASHTPSVNVQVERAFSVNNITGGGLSGVSLIAPLAALFTSLGSFIARSWSGARASSSNPGHGAPTISPLNLARAVQNAILDEEAVNAMEAYDAHVRAEEMEMGAMEAYDAQVIVDAINTSRDSLLEEIIEAHMAEVNALSPSELAARFKANQEEEFE